MESWNDPLKRRWILFGFLASLYMMVSLYRLSPAVLSEELMRSFQTSGAGIGNLHSAFFYVYAPLQLVVGVLVDRSGPRRTATAGAVLMNIGAVMFGLAGTYRVAFLARLLIGIGGSFLFLSILRFLANWYRADEFATMTGLTVSVSGVGGILATYPLAVVMTRIGWRRSMMGLGFIGLFLGVFVFLFVRDSPRRAGLPGIDGVPDTQRLSLSLVWSNFKAIIRERETWFIGGMFFFTVGVNITVFGLWGIPYVVQVYDVSVTHASLYTLVASLGLVLGPPVIGFVSDRIDVRVALMVTASAVFTASYAVIAVIGEPPLPVVGVIFFVTGFLAGGFALGLTVMKERHDATMSGTATGVVNGAGFMGAAVFPVILGVILDSYWTGEQIAGARVYTLTGYRVAFLVTAAAGLLTLVLTSLLYLSYRGEGDGQGEGIVAESI